MTDVGFIGLGAMGATMARRLVDAGHNVTVWNRSAEPTERLVAAGARRAETVTDALASGVVLSMLSNDSAAESIFSTELLQAAPPGSIHANFSSLSVAAADRLASVHAAAGVHYVAVPVLGRPNVAEQGQLNIVAGGEPAAIARLRPILDVLGKKTWIVGNRASAANLVKIGVNYNLIHTLQALAESVTLMEHGGVDGSTFVDILTDTAYTGSAYTGYGRMIATREYEPLFTVALGLKDLTLAEQAAAGSGVVLPTAPVLRDLFERTLADPALATRDWSAIAEVTRGLASDGSKR